MKNNEEESSGVLEAFATEFAKCWLCGTRAGNTWPPRLEIHHIARGPARAKAREERAALFRACQPCHRQRLDSMSVVVQLAVKCLADPAGYDRVLVNQLRGRADDAISEEDVAVAADAIRALNAVNDGFPFRRLL